jgi:hypothetical protein
MSQRSEAPTPHLQHTPPAQSLFLEMPTYLPTLNLEPSERPLSLLTEQSTPPSRPTVSVKYLPTLNLVKWLVTSSQQAFVESGKLEVLKVTSQQPVCMAT